MTKRVALVTGAGRGVGQAIARALCQHGWAVAVTDVDIRAAVSSAASIETDHEPGWGETLALALDVRMADSWAFALSETRARFGRVSALVNNAGISPRGGVEDTSLALWEHVLAVNLTGAFLGIQAAWPDLVQTRGSIVNIGSTRGSRPMRNLVAYGVSKAGLEALTRQVAIEGLKVGVTCNCLAAGWMDTPGERLIQASLGRPDFPAGLVNLIPLDHLGQTVAFLLAPQARHLNGVTLHLDSGLHIADHADLIFQPESRAPTPSAFQSTSNPSSPNPPESN